MISVQFIGNPGVRKYASPEPFAVNGTDEDSPIPQNITVPVGGAMNWTWYPS